MEKDSHNTYVVYLSVPRMFVVRNVATPWGANQKALNFYYGERDGYLPPEAKDVVEDKEFQEIPEISNGSCTMDEYAGDGAEEEIAKYFKEK